MPEPIKDTEEAFIPLVEDDDESHHSVSSSDSFDSSGGTDQAEATGCDGVSEDPLPTDETFSISDLALLAAPDGEEPLAPSQFVTQAEYNPPQAKPHNKAGAFVLGLLQNLHAMKDALLNRGRNGDNIAPTRKISLGGSFMLISGVLTMFFSVTQVSPEQLMRIQNVMGIESAGQQAYSVQNTSAMFGAAVIACLVGLVVLAWRYWSPRQEHESKVVTVVYWGILGLVVGSSMIALVGGGELTLLFSNIGSVGVLVAAAVFGVWLFLRLAADGDGSMALLLIGPAVILPAVFFIVVLANLPEGVEMGDVPWEKLFLATLVMFLLLLVMGGAISFLILLSLPFQILGFLESPSLPTGVSSGASGMGFIVIGGFCGLCYLVLVIARWRMMFKPVAWQFIILLIGGLLMLGTQNFAYSTMAAKVERQIAEEDERLTALLQAEGLIASSVTASHERFPNTRTEHRGYEREEVVHLSNGKSITRQGGFHEGQNELNRSTAPKFTHGGLGPSDASDGPGLAIFDPSLGRTDPGPVRFIEPGRDPRPEERQGIVRPENPNGMGQPGVLASWKPFLHSGHAQVRGARVLYLAKGGMIVGADHATLMAYGMVPDRRPKPVLAMVPQFDPRYLPPGAEPVEQNKRTGYNPEGEPVADHLWPRFIQPPTVDLSGAQSVTFFGYEMDILKGYEVKAMYRDPETRIRTLVIAREGGQDLEHPPLKVYLVPHTRLRKGLPQKGRFYRLVDIFDPLRPDPYCEFGLIGDQQFARISPDAWHLQAQGTRYYYVSKMPDTLYWVGISISSAMQSPGAILECEAMARSLRRVPAIAATIPKEITPGATAQSDAETVRKHPWKVLGVFAYPEAFGESLHASIDHGNEGFLSMNLSHDGEGLYFELHPKWSGLEAGFRVQADGPEKASATPATGHEGFTERAVSAFGRELRYDRLWNDEVFVRVDRGPTILLNGEVYNEIAYCGWLGQAWAEIRLRWREGSGVTLDDLESKLRAIRLAYPIEVIGGPDFEKWADHWVGNWRRQQGLPLAGGTTIRKAFVRQGTSGIIVSASIDPYGGLDPEVFAQSDSPGPGLPQVVVDPPGEQDPELPPGMEPVVGYQRWTTVEEAEQYLGNTERFVHFSFKPLKDLRASAKNTDRYAEWFARTGSGKVGMTLKYEKVPSDQAPIKTPLVTDPETGKQTLVLGRRVLKLKGTPDVTYRDGNGLRIWRVLMPQAGGSPVRRCYYLVSIKGANLVIAADYERGEKLQLQAMDASIATLVNDGPKHFE